MRKPLDNFSSDLLKSFCVLDRLRYEFIAAMFWLIERPMVLLLLESGHDCRPSLGEQLLDRPPAVSVEFFVGAFLPQKKEARP